MSRVSGQRDQEGELQRLGSAIQARRRAAGLSQEALADACGIDRSHMGKIERGERNVTLLNLIKIARSLNCSVSDLTAEANL